LKSKTDTLHIDPDKGSEDDGTAFVAFARVFSG
jgi:hypothetical protein